MAESQRARARERTRARRPAARAPARRAQCVARRLGPGAPAALGEARAFLS